MDDPTIPSNDRFLQYTYSGGELAFQYDFPVYSASDVTVYKNDLRLNFPIDYSVTISPAFDGGVVTLHTPPDDGDTITIVGATPLVRTEYYGNKAVVSPTALDAECSKTVMRLQQLNTKILGCLKNQLSETESDNTTLPATDDRKGKVAAWDNETGALTYFGNKGMDEIYLKRDKNLSDLTDVETARKNLNIIDGRKLVNNGKPVEYRQTMEFNKAFRLLNDVNKTVVSLALTVANVGTGIPLVTKFSENTIWARTLRTIGNISISVASDGSIVLSDEASTRGYTYKFDDGDWGENMRLTIPSTLHKVANDNNVLVSIRDEDGYVVNCNVMVENDGTVNIFSNVAFSGTALIYGGLYTMVPSGLLVNPMRAKGDVIISSDDNGAPMRLPIGSHDQVIVAGSDGLPTYKTLGTAAWKNCNIPGGPPLLDNNYEIPAEYLPFFSMTYKGTFGSSSSTTGGDLPSDGMLDGDIFVCDSEYFSQVAQKAFTIGQWAIFNGQGWDVIPLQQQQQSDGVPVGSIMPYAGIAVPNNYLPCNGYVLDRATYSQLFSVIGTTYNSGEESDQQFAIPNYNNEGRFLQGSTTAGAKTEAGLPNIYGSIPYDTWGGGMVSGAFYEAGHASGAKGGSDNNRFAKFDASRCSAIYGKSDTVQPPAQNVVFLIKFQ